jgi:hypothetical protein
MRTRGRTLRLFGTTLVAALVVAGCDEGASSAERPAPKTPVAVERVPALPIPVLDHHQLFAAHPYILMIGGYERAHGETRLSRRAAIYSTATGRWKKLDLPFSGPPYLPGAVWNGTRLIVVGAPCARDFPPEDTDPFCPDSKLEATTYSPKDDSWETIARPPELVDHLNRNGDGPPRLAGVGAIGRRAVFSATDESNRMVVYDPRADDWAAVSTRGEARESSRCVAHGHLYSVHQSEVEGRALSTDRYDPKARRWVPLGRQVAPGNANTFIRVFCQQGEMVAVTDAQMKAHPEPIGMLWFDPATGAWDPVPGLPAPFGVMTPLRIGTTRIVYTGFLSNRYWVLDDGASAWRRADMPSLGDDPMYQEYPHFWVQKLGDRILIEGQDPKGDLVVIDPALAAAG